MRMKRIAAIIMFLVVFFSAASFAGTVSFNYGNGPYNSLPEPRLRYPINDTVVLTGQDNLEFKWWIDTVGLRKFILKIFKGYNMYVANLIYKEDLSPDTSSLKVSSDLFEDGQVYTWSLVQISFSGFKSDRSFNSFKVIKER
jgi:hypothetical protein